MGKIDSFFRNNNLKNARWFITLISFFCLSFIVIQNINNRFWMHDFEVYYSAANSFIHGEKIYGIAYGLPSGFYKYSPFALLLFTPLTSYPFFVAKILHFTLLSVVIILNIIIAKNIICKYFFNIKTEKKQNLILFLIFLPLLPNVYTELHLGNINTILLFIFILAMQLLISGKNSAAGLLFALGILIKPHFIVFVPLLLLRKKFKCFAYTISGIVAGIILPALSTGIKNNFDLHIQWLTTMQMHNSSLISGHDTIYSWLYRSIGRFFFSDILRYDKIFALIVVALISIAILMLVIFHLRKESNETTKQDINEKNFVFEFLILLAIVPNITVTDTEHFLLSIPLIAFIVNFLFKTKDYLVYKIVGIACLVMFGMNIREIVGKNISACFSELGTLGLANFIIIIFCVVIHIKQINNSNLQLK